MGNDQILKSPAGAELQQARAIAPDGARGDFEDAASLVVDLELLQPPNRTARGAEEAVRLAEQVGYPLVVRPSYVLGGRAMEIVFAEDELRAYMTDAVKVSNDSPVLLDHFLDSAVDPRRVDFPATTIDPQSCFPVIQAADDDVDVAPVCANNAVEQARHAVGTLLPVVKLFKER